MSIVDFKTEERVPFVLGDDRHWQVFEKKEEFLELVNPINYEFATDPKTTSVLARPVSFYEDTLMLRVEDKNWKEDWAVFYFLCSGDKYIQAGSISEELWMVNEALTLNLKKHTLFDYVKFVGYFFAVDDDGSILALEDEKSEFIDCVPVPFSNALEKKRTFDKLSPPEVEGPDPEGDFWIAFDIISGEDLQRIALWVYKDGSTSVAGYVSLIGGDSYSASADYEENED